MVSRPGVYVEEAPLPRIVSPPNVSISAGAFIGTALMGPATPTLVTSWSQFNSTFGGFSSDADRTRLAAAVYQFFTNGGGACYVCRVLAGDASTATVTLNDNAETPNPLLTVDAVSPGLWGNGVAVDITHPIVFDDIEGPPPSVTLVFNLAVRTTVRGQSVTVERFSNLDMDPDSPRYVERIINDSTLGSAYITVDDLTAGTSPDALPAVVEAEYLTGGDEGTTTPGPADFASAIDLFESIEGNLVFNLPGTVDVTAAEAKIVQRSDSFLVVDGDNTNDVNAMIIASSLPVTSYSAVYFPWIAIADPDPTAARGALRWVPPGGSVVGMMMRTDATRGQFKAPAGIGAVLTGALATSVRLTNVELDALNANNINAIRPVPGSGITVMGARTRDFNSMARYISVRRTLNYVKQRAMEVSRFALFEPNTPALWEQLRVANGAFLSELWDAGGLAGDTIESGFYVKIDSDNNTPTTLANGEVHVEIGVAPLFPTEFVIIRLGQFESDAGFTVSEEI